MCAIFIFFFCNPSSDERLSKTRIQTALEARKVLVNTIEYCHGKKFSIDLLV